jgi:hypothetical protein
MFELPPHYFSKKDASKKAWEMTHNIRGMIQLPTIFYENEVYMTTVDQTDEWMLECRTPDFLPRPYKVSSCRNFI